MDDANIARVVSFDVVQDVGHQKDDVVFWVEVEPPSTSWGEAPADRNTDAVEVEGDLSRLHVDP
ncbi:hypothetical protein PspLS_07074 [Pyricularia sp. CBS 133598]|nr:hypothetical protein PspLS_07074 [Pyricularia sp. CBS 133598]